MPYACVRALRFSALLALPAAAFAQSTKGPTIFSPSLQVGTVNLRAAVVRTDYSVQPLPLLKVVALRTDRPDSASAETDLDGRLVMPLRVGTYTLRAKTGRPVAGRMYAWVVRVVVRPHQTEIVQFTSSNASMSDSVAATAVVAAAPATPPAPMTSAPAVTKQTTQRAAQPAASAVSEPSPFAPPTRSVETPVAAPAKRVAMPVRHEVAPRSRVNTSGFMLGLSFDASSIRSNDLASSTESGPGVAAQLGWGITKNFAFVLDASGARISSLGGSYDLAHADLGGRWHFVNRSGFVPFVDVGYAGRALTKKDAILGGGAGTNYTGDVAVLGTGVSFGGGFEYFATRSWALGGAFKWTTGQFSQVKVDNVTIDGLKIDATSARFNMGFTWYPMGR